MGFMFLGALKGRLNHFLIIVHLPPEQLRINGYDDGAQAHQGSTHRRAEQNTRRD
jgi:hypothetical protein